MVEPNRIDQGDETAAADDPLALMRGLVHGIILSMARMDRRVVPDPSDPLTDQTQSTATTMSNCRLLT